MSLTSDRRRTVRRAHRGALGVLAGCAAWIATLPATEASGEPPLVFPYVAITLGVGAITCRQLANRRRAKATLGFSIAVCVCGAGVGVVGLVLVWLEGMRQTALLYTVGGAILTLRSPESIPAGVRPEENLPDDTQQPK